MKEENRNYIPTCSNEERALPVGVKPQWLHDYLRAQELLQAIERYCRSGHGNVIPEEWFTELDKLCVKYMR